MPNGLDVMRRLGINPNRFAALRKPPVPWEQQWQGKEIEQLVGIADKPFDLSFMDVPGFREAEERATLEPIRRTFGTAQRRGYQQSLRTGQPISAGATVLAGQEGRAIREQTASNFLRNIRTGIDLAGRRFGQRFQISQFQEGRRRFEEELKEARKRRRAATAASIAGGLGELAGTGLAIAFPPKAAT